MTALQIDLTGKVVAVASGAGNIGTDLVAGLRMLATLEYEPAVPREAGLHRTLQWMKETKPRGV